MSVSRWNKCLNVTGSYMEVWFITNATHVGVHIKTTARFLASKYSLLCFLKILCIYNGELKKSLRGLRSSVGIATGYGLDGPWIESRWGARFSAPVRTSSGAHPASCTMGTESFLGVECGRGVMLNP
jgi:hypothetical protein